MTDAYGGDGPWLIATGWSLCFMGLLTMALRFYGVSRKTESPSYDLILAVAACIIGTAATAALTASIVYGMGNHLDRLDPAQTAQALESSWVSVFVGLVGTAFARWAVLALFLKLQSEPQTKRRILLWTIGVLAGAIPITQIALDLTQCRPAAKLWDASLPGSCPRAAVALDFTYAQAASGIVLDLSLALLPLAFLQPTQPLKTKLRLFLLTASGTIPTAAAATKLLALFSVAAPPASIPLWQLAELFAILALASCVALRPLLRARPRRPALRKSAIGPPVRKASVRGGVVRWVGEGMEQPSLPLQQREEQQQEQPREKGAGERGSKCSLSIYSVAEEEEEAPERGINVRAEVWVESGDWGRMDDEELERAAYF